ncbi:MULTISPECIES: darcynin family protein [unclassified Acinetobacter]|uniref:darcynin family protein n=1 Tax=unclassified Acinetobacter TaxID=196816 RepID=UPI0025756A86|nr:MULTISPECIES: darcynin family protein [unclassified Acinetobacter]MDM1764154.1 hypothetical protein [Acinetobacter sp. 226-1]MDM1767948.1 hypothetical protein [Acinetobacter sp. 226-4]
MFTIFILLKTTTEWLKLERKQRNQIADDAFSKIFKDESVSLKMFDAEAFSAKCTDVAMFQTENLKNYYFVIERLRDSVLITHPYFEIIDIIPTIEDGFKLFEAQQ